MKADTLGRLLANVEKLPPSECWWWTGTSGSGYGRMRVGGRTISAHRLAHELLIGPIPAGAFVLHRCDEKRCINPGHLFLGTQADNMTDKAKKRRGNRSRRGYPRGVQPSAHGCPGFTARVCSGGRLVYLGTFPTVAAAARAVEAQPL